MDGLKQETPDLQGGVWDFYLFNDLISPSQKPLLRRAPPLHLPAMPHPLLSSANTTSHSFARLAFETCPTNMALFVLVFFAPAPVGRSLGAARLGRSGSGRFEIIAMATPVKTVQGRPGLDFFFFAHFQSIEAGEAKHGVGCESWHGCTFIKIRFLPLLLENSRSCEWISRSSCLGLVSFTAGWRRATLLQLNVLQVKPCIDPKCLWASWTHFI